MKTMTAILMVPLLSLTLASRPARSDELPADGLPVWAYPVNPDPAPPPGAPLPPDDGTLHHVPNSTAALTKTEIAGREIVPDWHPEDHPAMPDIVSKGRQPAVRPCGYCHQPSGAGRPENAAVAGLTPAYIKEQIQVFKAGNRKGSEPKRGPQNQMTAYAAAVTDAEIEAAAAYFSSLKPVSFVTVKELPTAPKTAVVGGMLNKTPDGAVEPIGNRIIEVPEEATRAIDRDPRTTYVAYVPVGSLAKGGTLVSTGGGKTVACGICHGPDLKGLGDVPRIAGRSPSYIVRQLYDIQHGTRSGPEVALMKQVVDKLNQDDMIAIAAYVANQKP